MTIHPAATFVCTGRPVDRDNQPVGEPCGRTVALSRIGTEAELVQIARAAGWAVSDRRADGGRDVMCPRCRRPDPALTKLLQELTR